VYRKGKFLPLQGFVTEFQPALGLVTVLIELYWLAAEGKAISVTDSGGI
jgi:hypothetical protein